MIRVIKKMHVLAFVATLGLFSPVATSEVLIDEVVEHLPKISERELRCLAKNIYYESRGEPKEGKIAVAIVTLNRVNHKDHPDTICEVVNENILTKSGKKICQFSWACDTRTVPKASDPAWQDILIIARKVMLGAYDDLQEKYRNSRNFHSVNVNPGWKLKRIGRVGNHIFYK